MSNKPTVNRTIQDHKIILPRESYSFRELSEEVKKISEKTGKSMEDVTVSLEDYGYTNDYGDYDADYSFVLRSKETQELMIKRIAEEEKILSDWIRADKERKHKRFIEQRQRELANKTKALEALELEMVHHKEKTLSKITETKRSIEKLQKQIKKEQNNVSH